jgi:hypothetical protein
MAALPTVRFGDFDGFGNLDLLAKKGRKGRSPPSAAFRRIPPVREFEGPQRMKPSAQYCNFFRRLRR